MIIKTPLDPNGHWPKMLSINFIYEKVKLPSLHFIFIFCFAILTICFRELARGSKALSSVGFQRKLRKILEPENH
jgi:hypothetical protein